MVLARSPWRRLVLGVASLVGVAQHAAIVEGNYTNIIVSEEGGGFVASSVQSASTQDLPAGTIDLTFAAGADGFDGHVVVAGPSALQTDGGSNIDKARELRHAAMLFAQWLNSERGGLRVAGRRLSLTLQWVDDRNSKLQVANATARALRLLPADFAMGGYSSGLTEYSAAQARADGKLMVVAGASRTTLFTEDPVVFGFLPSGNEKHISIFESILHIATEVDAGRVNASNADACGSVGCRAQLRYGALGACPSWKLELADAYFGAVSEPASDETSPEEFRLALGILKASNVTVLEICKLSVAQFKNITEIMEALSFEVYVLISTSTVLTPEFEELTQNGWWQSAYTLDATPWIPVPGAQGSFSGMTSEEFADKYYTSWGESPTYLGAAQYSALCALCAAIESADSLDSVAVAEKLRNLSLLEFYGEISFNAAGQILLDHLVLQAPQADLHAFEPEVIYPPTTDRTRRFVFPKPPWSQERCRYNSKTADGQECSGNGLCSLEGQCICSDTWQGSYCELSILTNSSAEDELEKLVDWIIGVSIAVACTIVMCVIAGCLRRRRRKLEASYLQQLEEAVLRDAEEQILDAKRSLCSLGWTPHCVDTHLSGIRRRNSEEAGVSVAYILSQDFLDLAQSRTGKADPTFHDLKNAFFFTDQPIGADIVCPRDGRLGCALIDTLSPQHRQRATHFLSWTWAYSISIVRDALRHWLKISDSRAEEVFVYMCFFVNNQHRILVSAERTGSEDLGRCFESNLTRIGNVVALLDTWDKPRYLTRIWTIFEQLIAIKLGIPVTIVLPEHAAEDLLLEIEQGKSGILRVKEALTRVDSKSAKATCIEDEKAVKALIQKSFSDGFAYVDDQIIKFMVHWVGHEMEAHMKALVTKGEAASPSRGKARESELLSDQTSEGQHKIDL
mmetsp:Transcript_7593/g.19340  ORF Transcript_7593/g.19340 Transcript_7593/m.19340 type:complete len:910 (+) Transcript_7593:59-2788(+)